MSKVTVPFYFGLGSRYSYLASTQLDRLEHELDCTFEWLPFASEALFSRANNGRNPFREEPSSGQYNWTFRERDAKAWADYYGVPFLEPVSFRLDPADMAKACWFADRYGLLKPLARLIMNAIFVKSKVIDRPLLAAMGCDLGLNDSELIDALDLPELEEKHEQVLQRALSDDAFGVPTFIVGDNLFWGNDRLPLVAHAIRNIRSSEN